MFGQMLYAQWKWSRDLLGFFVVAGFVLPLVVLWFVIPRIGPPSARELVMIGQTVGWFCLGVSVLAGGVIAVQGYGVDDRAGHIYSLSLPVTRARFLGTRTVTAFALLALPAIAIWIGSALAASQLTLPDTLRSYSGALALRALMAAWLVHSCMFALRYSAGPRAKAVLLVLLACVVAVALASAFLPGARLTIERLGNLLITHPGPFGVLFGRWTLIDV